MYLGFINLKLKFFLTSGSVTYVDQQDSKAVNSTYFLVFSNWLKVIFNLASYYDWFKTMHRLMWPTTLLWELWKQPCGWRRLSFRVTNRIRELCSQKKRRKNKTEVMSVDNKSIKVNKIIVVMKRIPLLNWVRNWSRICMAIIMCCCSLDWGTLRLCTNVFVKHKYHCLKEII